MRILLPGRPTKASRPVVAQCLHSLDSTCPSRAHLRIQALSWPPPLLNQRSEEARPLRPVSPLLTIATEEAVAAVAIEREVHWGKDCWRETALTAWSKGRRRREQECLSVKCFKDLSSLQMIYSSAGPVCHSSSWFCLCLYLSGVHSAFVFFLQSIN